MVQKQPQRSQSAQRTSCTHILREFLVRRNSASFAFSAVAFALMTAAGHAQTQPVTITPRLDTPQVRVIVATLRPRMPVNARTGHATDRVIIYLDNGTMT